MKIMHVITGLKTGGAEMMLFKLLATRDRRQFRHEVVSLQGGGAIANKISRLGIPITSLDMNSGRPRLSGFLKLRTTISKVRPDILQGWMYHGNLAASLGNLGRREKIPVVWNIRHSLSDLANEKPSTRVVMKIGAVCSNLAASIVYNARTSLQQHESFGFSNRNSIVIPNGFDIEHFKPSRQLKRKTLQSIGIGEGKIVIGQVARYHPSKGHTAFLRSVAVLSKQHPNVRFLLAGAGIENSNTALAALISELELKDKVFLLGERTDMHAIIASLDILCVASYGEGFSNAIGEAMACAVPCVVTDVGDSAWIVGQTGIVAPARNHQALAMALTRMLDENQYNRHRLGWSARQRIINKFSLDQCKRKYELLYTSLTSRTLHAEN